MKKLLLSAVFSLAFALSLGAVAQGLLSPYTYTNTAVTVTSASTQVIAANYTRRYFSIQNNHATANIYCTPTATATTANGVKIAAGQMWVPYMPSLNNAINCIGDTSSNTTVVITEGN